MKKNLNYLLIGALLVSGLTLADFGKINQAKAFDANNLMSDAEFIDYQTLDANGVQAFLNTRGGTRLRTFSEGGRTAAQIISSAATANRINPFVILATIQKEESLIDSNTNFDYRVTWAMGYGVCDSCSLDDPSVARYRGFTNQINYGAWQLKYNYLVWAANGSSWNVGKTMIIDGTAIRFANRATSSLYRYTPHLSGNGSFYDIYNRYKTYRAPASYDAKLIVQVPRANYTVRPGQRFMMLVSVRNTGTAVWTKAGGSPMRLGNYGPQDRGSAFTNGANVRWEMLQSTVRRNGVGSFRIYFTAPQQTGVYVEKFRPVMEGITWLGPEITYTFNVTGSQINTKSKTPTTTTQPAPSKSTMTVEDKRALIR